MITRKSYVIRIYKKDARCKTGERHIGSYKYAEVEDKWIQEELSELQRAWYRRGDGFKVELASVEQKEK